MSRRDEQWKQELADNLKKAGRELALGVAQEAAEQLSRARERREHQREERRLREEWHQAKRERRRQKREARRQRQLARQSGPAARAEGAVFALAALAFLTLAFTTGLWWMAFIALGMGLAAAPRLVGGPARALPAAASSREEAVPTDARAARIEEVCNRLKAALAEAPQGVRDFLSNQPEQTVEALRRTCLDLLQRELSLRALASPEEAARLEGEREGLREKIAASQDEVVRARLVQALAALEHQRAQHAQVRQSADRLEAERVRLGYTLDGLLAQVMRLRTLDAGGVDVAGAGLRVSLEQLREELGALAEAAEEVNRLEWTARGQAPGAGERLEEVDASSPGRGAPVRERR